MARKEKRKNRWIKTERVGNVTLFVTRRSPYWWMYWREPAAGGKEPRPRYKSTRETDLGLARVIAAKKNEELFKRKQCPEVGPEYEPYPLADAVGTFVAHLEGLGRSFDYVRNIRSRLNYLGTWMGQRRRTHLHEVTPELLAKFVEHLRTGRKVTAATANDYLDAARGFFDFAIHKRKLVGAPNPAAMGRRATLDRLPETKVRPPTLYPDQINAVLESAVMHGDHQIVNLVVFVCEGGFRFQELQFLQVGDIDLDAGVILLDVKKPAPDRVRSELKRRCLTADGLWIPKSQASRRPVHITARLSTVIKTMGMGQASDWVFVNQAGNQVAGNKTLLRLKRYALEANVMVEPHPATGKPWSLIRWHWLRHYHRTRAHVSKIRREVSKLAMGHAGDYIHDHYRGVDVEAFHAEYAKFDSGLDDSLLAQKKSTQ